MSSQLGLDIQIKVDKDASTKDIKKYLDELSKTKSFQNALTVGFDSKEFTKMLKDVSQLSKQTISPLADEMVQVVKELILANGDLLKVVETIDKNGDSQVERVELQTNKTKKFAEKNKELLGHYKEMNKLVDEKFKMEKLIANNQGQDNRKEKKQLETIQEQIEARRKLIRTHEL